MLCSWRLEEIGSPKSGVIEGCKRPDVGAEN